MKLHLTFRALLLAALSWQAVPSCNAQSEPVKLYAKSYALVIGINKYKVQEGWPELQNAARDAESMEKLLRRMGFEVTSLYNDRATKEAIEDALHELAQKVEPNDGVLFYFAGHGYTEKLSGNDVSYIVPSDATQKPSSYIAVDSFERFSRYMDRAKHQLFIFDSAFGGALGTGEKTKTPEDKEVRIQRNTRELLFELTRPKVREVITAGMTNEKIRDGADETPGHSLFSGRLLEALNGAADYFHDGYITFTEVKDYLNRNYANSSQHLHTATLPGHTPGRDFVFKNPALHP